MHRKINYQCVLRATIITLILSGITTTAFSDVPPEAVNQPYNGAGAYINLNAGFGTTQHISNNSFVAGASAGYNFNRAFALEGGYTMLPTQQSGQSSAYNIFDAAIRGTLPLSSLFSLYGRLGVAMGYSCSACTGSANYGGLLGAGASFALSRHLDLRVEDYAFIPLNNPNNGFGNVNIVTGGVQYNF